MKQVSTTGRDACRPSPAGYPGSREVIIKNDKKPWYAETCISHPSSDYNPTRKDGGGICIICNMRTRNACSRQGQVPEQGSRNPGMGLHRVVPISVHTYRCTYRWAVLYSTGLHPLHRCDFVPYPQFQQSLTNYLLKQLQLDVVKGGTMKVVQRVMA